MILIVEKNGLILSLHQVDPDQWEIKDDRLYIKGRRALFPVSAFGVHPVPDQDLSHLARDEEGRLQAYWPDDIPIKCTDEEQMQLIDNETGKAIDQAIHPFAGIWKELQILREQIEANRKAAGAKQTGDFARLQKLAKAKIKEGKARKALLAKKKRASYVAP